MTLIKIRVTFPPRDETRQSLFSTRASATIVEVTQALTAPVYLLFGFVLFPPFRKLPETKCQNNFFFWGFTKAAYICVNIFCVFCTFCLSSQKGRHTFLRFITSLYGVTPIFGQAKGTEPGVWGQHFKCFLSEGEKEALEGTSPLSSCYRKKRRWWKTYLTNLFCSVFLWSVM